MTQYKSHSRTLLRLAALATAGFLAACGSDSNELELSNLVKKSVTSRGNKAAVAESQQAVLKVTRAQVDATPLPLLRMRIERTGALSTLVEVDRKGNNTTFHSADGGGFMFKSGILIGTRGLGQDLLSLRTPTLAQAVAKGQSTRRYRYLSGDEDIIILDVNCTLSSKYLGGLSVLDVRYDVDEITEWCAGSNPVYGDLEFQNFYWAQTSNGRIVQSRQYISPKFGHAEIEVLTR